MHIVPAGFAAAFAVRAYLAAAALAALLAAGLAASIASAASDAAALRAERSRTEANFRRLDGAARTALARCRAARGLAQRCDCLRQVTRVQAELALEKRRVSSIHEALLLAAKETIRQNQEDKKYFLQKLQQMNETAERLSEEQAALTGASRRLGRMARPGAASGGAEEEPVSEARCRAAGPLREAPRSAAQPRLPQVAPRHARRAENIDARVQYALRESYLRNVEALRSYAERVDYFNKKKKELRDLRREAHEHIRASGHDCGPGAPPAILRLCKGIAQLDRRLREIEQEERRAMRRR